MLPFVFASLTAILMATSCSTPETRFGSEPDESTTEASTADASSWGAGAMMLRKNQKIRPKNDFHFYFKRCDQDDKETFYSKTSYYCNDPY